MAYLSGCVVKGLVQHLFKWLCVIVDNEDDVYSVKDKISNSRSSFYRSLISNIMAIAIDDRAVF